MKTINYWQKKTSQNTSYVKKYFIEEQALSGFYNRTENRFTHLPVNSLSSPASRFSVGSRVHTPRIVLCGWEVVVPRLAAAACERPACQTRCAAAPRTARQRSCVVLAGVHHLVSETRQKKMSLLFQSCSCNLVNIVSKESTRFTLLVVISNHVC